MDGQSSIVGVTRPFIKADVTVNTVTRRICSQFYRACSVSSLQYNLEVDFFNSLLHKVRKIINKENYSEKKYISNKSLEPLNN